MLLPPRLWTSSSFMSYGFPVTSRPPLRININLLDTSWALWHGELNLVVTWRAPLAYGQYRTCVISQRADTDHRSPLNGISGRRQAERSAGLELGAGAAQRGSCCQRRGLGKRDTGERVVYETRRQHVTVSSWRNTAQGQCVLWSR